MFKTQLLEDLNETVKIKHFYQINCFIQIHVSFHQTLQLLSFTRKNFDIQTYFFQFESIVFEFDSNVKV